MISTGNVVEVVKPEVLPAVKAETNVDVPNQIKAWHEQAVHHGKMAICYALQIGRTLVALKKNSNHGQFTALKQATGINLVTINNYMRVAVDFERRANLQKLELLDKNGMIQITAEVAEKIVKVVDGKSLTQLYWDWGIKKNDGKTGGFKGGKKLSPDARRAANIKLARAAWIRIYTSLSHEIREESYKLLSVPEREDIVGRLKDALKILRRHLK